MGHFQMANTSRIPPRHTIRLGFPALTVIFLALMLPQEGRAGQVTQCTKLDICYCINTDYRDAISENVARVRQLIAGNKAQGKAVGYLSVPLSPAGGGSF